MRYVVNISFIQNNSFLHKKIDSIVEPCKTLVEAKSFKSLIDDTVKNAVIYDKVKEKIVVWK